MQSCCSREGIYLNGRAKTAVGAKWKLENDYMEVVPGTGQITTRESFGDVFLHVEWASPDEPKRTGQDRGNSGIFFMGKYELQVLDSYQADSYADGQAGALYGQIPPRLMFVSHGENGTATIYPFADPVFQKTGNCFRPQELPLYIMAY